jgi:putative transposase
MPNYRRAWCPGGTYFFTVNLLERRGNDLLIRHIELLKESIRAVKQRHPFEIHAWIVLPDHLHCVIELPENDADFSLRWRLIKMGFSKSLPRGEHLSEVRRKRSERGIWQRRFWEHLIRNEEDYQAHMDYVHINPVKHGIVDTVVEWPHSTFHRLVKEGLYPAGWAGGSETSLGYWD